jgi:hypothetical protein
VIRTALTVVNCREPSDSNHAFRIIEWDQLPIAIERVLNERATRSKRRRWHAIKKLRAASELCDGPILSEDRPTVLSPTGRDGETH